MSQQNILPIVTHEGPLDRSFCRSVLDSVPLRFIICHNAHYRIREAPQTLVCSPY